MNAIKYGSLSDLFIVWPSWVYSTEARTFYLYYNVVRHWIIRNILIMLLYTYTFPFCSGDRQHNSMYFRPPIISFFFFFNSSDLSARAHAHRYLRYVPAICTADEWSYSQKHERHAKHYLYRRKQRLVTRENFC